MVQDRLVSKLVCTSPTPVKCPRFMLLLSSLVEDFKDGGEKSLAFRNQGGVKRIAQRLLFGWK